MKLNSLLEKLLKDKEQGFHDNGRSIIIQDRRVIEQFLSNPANTLLVSFPRTGSHWLRMLMELYFERPTLKLVFYFPEVTNYLAYHTHDLDLDIEHPTVLYLYRDPVDTIYSQLSFYKEPLDDVERIRYWSDLYGRHLDKWLCQERFTSKKTILRYENLKQNLAAEFAKVTAHFGEPFDAQKLERAAVQASKEEIQRKTPHDPRVINLQNGYQSGRQNFRQRHGFEVWEIVLAGREHLREYLEFEQASP
jgi:hypothetical protein